MKKGITKKTVGFNLEPETFSKIVFMANSKSLNNSEYMTYLVNKDFYENASKTPFAETMIKEMNKNDRNKNKS